ncbi:DUF4232 domain-containing protein [Streptomyces sp. NPDC057307]|uniref:DUF4232 domain-containing protein n=1 Tax=Streptomyces sp. NPDC057307 TaxID=3346096 RepID=UPI00363945D5
MTQPQPLGALFAGAGVGGAGSAGGGSNAGGSGGDGGGIDDELALRRLLHGAVQEIEPSAGALDHLRRAVPARRARKRQAFVGVAAAALLISTAVPAFVHVANTGSSSDDKSFNVGHGEQVQGGTGSDGGPKDSEKDGTDPSDKTDSGKDGSGDKDKPETSDGGNTGGTSGGGGGDPESSFTNSTATCDASQLDVTADAGEPQADGTVYGRFRISNASGTDCSVSGHGSVGFLATGAADPSKIEVVDHTPGDPASGLPDPSMESASLVLPPSGAYEVMFAWVPTDTCPTGEPSPNPSPTEGDSGGATNGTGSTPIEQPSPQLGSDEGPEDGSIDVVHTPESGSEPAATTTIENACAGTIYRTGVLEAS